MARADLLTNLIEKGINGDFVRFRKVAETIIAEERAKQHTILSDRLEKILRESDKRTTLNGKSTEFAKSAYRAQNLMHEIIPEKQLGDLVLPKDVLETCREVTEEHHRAELLRSYNLEPRNRVLLTGPPGNGKTSLAEALAESLMLPLYVVRYEGVVGAFLGETANRVHSVIEHASTRRCVLFFDEFETLGKERGDKHETGEIKRVVSSLLMQIDNLPSHVLVVGATNHPELLDRAVWRRFQVRMNLPLPTRENLEEWFERFQQRTNVSLELASSTLAKKLLGVNFAEVEEFGSTVMRRFVLEQPGSDMKKIVDKTLKMWTSRSVTVSEKDE